jgi:hypothetical protein
VIEHVAARACDSAARTTTEAPSDFQRWTAEFELALESRYESLLATPPMTQSDVLRAVLGCVAEAWRQMGW